jgi:hypothetical protein
VTAFFHVVVHPSTGCVAWQFFKWSDDIIAQETL